MLTSKLNQIKSILGDAVLSVLTYQRHQDSITVFILTNVDYIKLDSLRKTFQKEKFIIFIENDIIRGKDVLPLEFLHIKNNHLLIEGHDYFSTLTIEKKHLKLKLEQELRNKLIYLREQYLLVKKRETFLRTIIPTMSILFEGLNYLTDQENQGFEHDLHNIEKNYNINLSVFKEIQEAAKHNFNLSTEKTNQLIQSLNDTLVTLNQKVDAL